MCDQPRKGVTFFFVVLVCALAEPQLDLPQYQDQQYRPQNTQYQSQNQNQNQNPYNQQNPQFGQYSPQQGNVDYNARYPQQNPQQGQYPQQQTNLQYPQQNPQFGQYPQPNPQFRQRNDGIDDDDDDDRGRAYNRQRDDNFRRTDERTTGYRQDIRNLLQQLETQSSQQCTNNVAAQWNFETNVNQYSHVEALQAQQQYSEFQHGVWDLLKSISRDSIDNPYTWRQVRYQAIVGAAALPPDQLDRYNRLINDMLAVYNGATVCALNDPLRCDLKLQPDLVQIMARSRNWDELQHMWVEWRRATGRQYKDLYEQLVVLTNEAAHLNNFSSAAEYWMFPYELPTLALELEEVWEEVKPLYSQLHAYVRRKLRDYYGPEKISRRAPLPAHILGNMWAQSWSNIFEITVPYPGKDYLDVGPEMLRQGYTPLDMFRIAEEFFVSLNMTSLPIDFWASSVLEEPLDRPALCQPSAWDFCNRQDFRIKMCTKVTMKDLLTAHHELAHIHYFIQYRNQPKVFRDGANPGFHEAIGEAVALSVGTPKHMQTLGLLQVSVDETPVDINYLYNMALDKLAFLPFALTMDKWRWDAFKGDVFKDQYNCNWWRMREYYSGVKPPVLRSEDDFDPGSKYHIPANIPYIRYFVGTVLQFQLHRSMCRASGQYDPDDPLKPLHKCDIYRSKEAGAILRSLMEKGSSQPWMETLLQATGESKLDGTAMREYFRPLEEWLRLENLRTQEFIGWVYDGDYCKQSIETAGLQVYGGFYGAGPISAPSSFLVAMLAALFVLLSAST